MVGLYAGKHGIDILGFGRIFNRKKLIWHKVANTQTILLGNPVANVWGNDEDSYTFKYPSVVTDVGEIHNEETYILQTQDGDGHFSPSLDSIELTGDCKILASRAHWDDRRHSEGEEKLYSVQEIYEDLCNNPHVKDRRFAYIFRQRHYESMFTHEYGLIQSVTLGGKSRPVRSITVSSQGNVFLVGPRGVPIRASLHGENWAP